MLFLIRFTAISDGIPAFSCVMLHCTVPIKRLLPYGMTASLQNLLNRIVYISKVCYDCITPIYKEVFSI